MSYVELALVNTQAGVLDGLGRKDVRVQTGIHSAGQHHHVVKDAQSIHTVRVQNTTRRTMRFEVSSELPDDDVVYIGDSKSRSWSPMVKVGGIKSGWDRPRWEPAKRAISHEATCPKGNGHHADIAVRVTTGLAGENIEVVSTEEEHVYRFTCAC